MPSSKSRLSVCELPDRPDAFADAWKQLVAHIAANKPNLVCLPELPFSPWLAWSNDVSLEKADEAVAVHQEWVRQLPDLGCSVIASRPVWDGEQLFNEAFIWTDNGYRAIRRKRYLPEERGYWEASWFARSEDAFHATDTPLGSVGVQICTEIWFTEHARSYGRQGIKLLAVPRVTEEGSLEKWLVAGRAAAILSGAFCISSNRTPDGREPDFAGVGWIIDPDGVVLAETSSEEPFVTVEVDLAAAIEAKTRYPRYVLE